MWIQIRSMDGKRSAQLDGLSKLTKIEDLRIQIYKAFEISCDKQRLFFSGKQLEDGHTLFDYGVTLNSLIQVMERQLPLKQNTLEVPENEEKLPNGHEETGSNEQDMSMTETEDLNNNKSTESEGDVNGIYKIDELVDARDGESGAWSEGIITKITRSKNTEETGAMYHCIYEGFDETEIHHFYEKDLRPRSRTKINWEQLTMNEQIRNHDPTARDSKDDQLEIELESCQQQHSGQLVVELIDDAKAVIVQCFDPQGHVIGGFQLNKGDKVMVNYNPDEPKERGDWFDCVVTRKETKRNRNELFGILSFGEEHSDVTEECKVIVTDEIFKIEKFGEVEPLMKGDEVCKRKGRYECTKCYDDESKPCKECGCSVCSQKTNPDKLVLCDECDLGYHLSCLKPPLESVPDEEWYCPKCKNDTSQVIKPGDKLKISKKRLKMASTNSTSNRDWGKGMACAGRAKVCTIVPYNHFGPIPGVEVGTCWRFQIMAGEAGVHRNHVGGISGRGNEGAFSILVSGGYEDDIDNGDEVLYTGSGGRDLSGNKRTADQSCDQKLERFNRALAVNCAAPIDEKNGATAVDWRAGKPTRLVRSFKLRKHHPKYAPEEGYRYDGIYKVVKYWPQKGQSGFLVWRYMLRRDDEVPAPWTKEGKKRINDLGIKIQYPEGYLEAEARKREEKEKEKEAKRLARKSVDGASDKTESKGLIVSFTKKRKRESVTSEKKPDISRSPKKTKSQISYTLPEDLISEINKDKKNKKIWNQVMDQLDNYQTFLSRIQDSFSCICCQELLFEPITTECKHNICKSCLQRSFKAEVFTCPVCRFLLGTNYKVVINDHLATLLKTLFPGYTVGR